MTTNKSLSNQEPLEPSERNKHHVDFRNADHHALQVQSFYAWLHPDLHDLPGIAWTEMPSIVVSYLVKTVGNSSYAPHIALAVGTALGAVAPLTLRYFAARLNILLDSIRTHCDSWNGPADLTREVWEEYVARETHISRRVHCLRTYTILTRRYIVGYVQSLDSEQRGQASPYILPVLPNYFLQQYGTAPTQQRHKNPSRVTTSILHHQSAPPSTEYYSQMAVGLQMDREKWAVSVMLSIQDARTLEQMEEGIRAVLEHRQMLPVTTFGFCTQSGTCSCNGTRSFVFGCPHLVPNPAKRFAIIQWREAYAERARELEARGAKDDAHQARLRVKELDNLLSTIDEMQQTIQDGTSTPPFILPPGQEKMRAPRCIRE